MERHSQGVQQHVLHYDYNLTPLQHAGKGGYKTIVDLLVANGADIDGGGYCDTPLQLAARGGHKAIVNLLVTNGANVDDEGKVDAKGSC